MSDGNDILAALFYGTLGNAAHSLASNNTDPHTLPFCGTIDPANLQLSYAPTSGASDEMQVMQHDWRMSQIPSSKPHFIPPPQVPTSFAHLTPPDWNGFGGQMVSSAYPFGFQFPAKMPYAPPGLGGYSCSTQTAPPPVLSAFLPQTPPTNGTDTSSGPHCMLSPPSVLSSPAPDYAVGPSVYESAAVPPVIPEVLITCFRLESTETSSLAGKRQVDALASIASQYSDFASSIRPISVETKPTFRCTICHDSVEGTMASIRGHMRWDHSLEINSKCECIHPGCATIVKVDGMARHVLTHIQRKRVNCALCGRKFARSDSALIHLKRKQCKVLRKVDGDNEAEQPRRKRVKTK